MQDITKSISLQCSTVAYWLFAFFSSYI